MPTPDNLVYQLLIRCSGRKPILLVTVAQWYMPSVRGSADRICEVPIVRVAIPHGSTDLEQCNERLWGAGSPEVQIDIHTSELLRSSSENR